MALNMQLVSMLDRLSIEYKDEVKRFDELDDLLGSLYEEQPIDLTGCIHAELGIRRQLCECLKLRIDHLRRLLFETSKVENGE